MVRRIASFICLFFYTLSMSIREKPRCYRVASYNDYVQMFVVRHVEENSHVFIMARLRRMLLIEREQEAERSWSICDTSAGGFWHDDLYSIMCRRSQSAIDNEDLLFRRRCRNFDTVCHWDCCFDGLLWQRIAELMTMM